LTTAGVQRLQLAELAACKTETVHRQNHEGGSGGIQMCARVCVSVGLLRVYVLILSFVLSLWAVVGAL